MTAGGSGRPGVHQVLATLGYGDAIGHEVLGIQRALEAWGLGRPVLANGRCDVLKGQCIRSNAGLYYERYEEFVETLYSLESNGPLHARLGQNGRDYFRRHYSWPVIERKYLDMLQQLSRAGAAPAAIEPLPGWLARRRRSLRPAADILADVPSGPVVAAAQAAAR